MKLFEILDLRTPEVTPADSKIHLATWNGRDDPLNVFLAGKFEGWQSWQGKKNFERPYIVSLIKLSGRDRWLFAGCYRQLGTTWLEKPTPHWVYKTEEMPETGDLTGRIVVHFKRSGRAAYLNANRWASELDVGELLPERMVVSEFPGYQNVRLDSSTLDLVVAQQIQSWKGPLSAVAGVYLITDTKTGKLYVGSATGQGGIWARWCSYAGNGHGGNKDLRKLLKDKGSDHARHFQYAVLEIADTHTSDEQVLQRESHWKLVLCSREHGYNAN